MEKNKADKPIKLSRSVVFRRLAKDDGLLIDTDSKNYYSLNETACSIISMIQKGKTSADIVKGLSLRYLAARKDIKRDVESTISDLIRDKILYQ